MAATTPQPDDENAVDATDGTTYLVHMYEQTREIVFLTADEKPVHRLSYDSFASLTDGLWLDCGRNIAITAQGVAELQMWANLDSTGLRQRAELATPAPTGDDAALAGIAAATDADLMPRLVAQHIVNGYQVSIIEPCLATDDDVRRGYLWHAVIGDFTLVPTRTAEYGYADYVPGGACRPDGSRLGDQLVATSMVSAKQAATNARRILRRRAPGPLAATPAPMRAQPEQQHAARSAEPTPAPARLTDRDIKIGDKIGIQGARGATAPRRWTPIKRGFMIEVTYVSRTDEGTLVGGIQITQTGRRVKAETYRQAFISGVDGGQWNTVPRFNQAAPRRPAKPAPLRAQPEQQHAARDQQPNPAEQAPARPVVLVAQHDGRDPLPAEVWEDIPGNTCVQVVYTGTRRSAHISRKRILGPASAADPLGAELADKPAPADAPATARTVPYGCDGDPCTILHHCPGPAESPLW